MSNTFFAGFDQAIADSPLFGEDFITGKPLTQMEAIVLSIFRARGNLTDTELGTHYELLWSSQGWPFVRPDTPRKRRSDLAKRGVLVDSGEKRPNGFGSLEAVWVLA